MVHVAGDDLAMPVAGRLVARPSGLAAALASVAVALAEATGRPLEGEVAKAAANIASTDEARAIAKSLAGRERASVLLGNYAQQHPEFAALAAIAREIARLAGAKLGILAQNANSVGAKLVGAHPLAGGLDTRAMIANPPKAWIVAGFEPERDAALAPAAIAALGKAEFVVALSAWRCWAPEYAHVILPIAPSAETAGTFVNMEGRVQSFHAVVKPRGDARPGWKVLRMLGSMLGLEGFGADSDRRGPRGDRAGPPGLGGCGPVQRRRAVRLRDPRARHGPGARGRMARLRHRPAGAPRAEPAGHRRREGRRQGAHERRHRHRGGSSPSASACA